MKYTTSPFFVRISQSTDAKKVRRLFIENDGTIISLKSEFTPDEHSKLQGALYDAGRHLSADDLKAIQKSTIDIIDRGRALSDLDSNDLTIRLHQILLSLPKSITTMELVQKIRLLSLGKEFTPQDWLFATAEQLDCLECVEEIIANPIMASLVHADSIRNVLNCFVESGQDGSREAALNELANYFRKYIANSDAGTLNHDEVLTYYWGRKLSHAIDILRDAQSALELLEERERQVREQMIMAYRGMAIGRPSGLEGEIRKYRSSEQLWKQRIRKMRYSAGKDLQLGVLQRMCYRVKYSMV